jgi:hypothetical protein
MNFWGSSECRKGEWVVYDLYGFPSGNGEENIALPHGAIHLLTSGKESFAHRLKLIDAAVRHQRQEEMTVFDDVRSDKLPLLDDLIMEGTGRARSAGERKQAELELIRSRRLPGASTPVAVDPYAYMTIGPEGDGVLCLVVRDQSCVVAPLEPDKLPGGAAEIEGRTLWRRLNGCHAGGE